MGSPCGHGYGLGHRWITKWFPTPSFHPRCHRGNWASLHVAKHVQIDWNKQTFIKQKINPKSIPNSQKQRTSTNTQRVKCVYCPALLTLEAGHARRNHSANALWKPFSTSVCNTVAAEGRNVFPKELLPASLFTSYLTYIIHISYSSFPSPTFSTPSSLHHHDYHHHHHHHHHHHLSHIIYITYTIFLSTYLHDIHHLQHIHYLHRYLYHYILYIAYIFYTIVSTSTPTISPYIAYNIILIIYNIDNIIYTSSTSNWTPTKLLQGHLHRNCYTGVVRQELLHRSSANFQVIKLYLNSYKILLLKFFYFSLPAGTARWWLTKRDPSRRVGHPNVWRNAGFVCPWTTLCGDRACRMGKHVVKCEPSLPPAVSRDRAWWTQTCGEIRISCGHVRRDRTGRTSKHVAKCEFGEARSHEMRVKQPQFINVPDSNPKGSADLRVVGSPRRYVSIAWGVLLRVYVSVWSQHNPFSCIEMR